MSGFSIDPTRPVSPTTSAVAGTAPSMTTATNPLTSAPANDPWAIFFADWAVEGAVSEMPPPPLLPVLDLPSDTAGCRHAAPPTVPPCPSDLSVVYPWYQIRDICDDAFRTKAQYIAIPQSHHRSPVQVRCDDRGGVEFCWPEAPHIAEAVHAEACTRDPDVRVASCHLGTSVYLPHSYFAAINHRLFGDPDSAGAAAARADAPPAAPAAPASPRPRRGGTPLPGTHPRSAEILRRSRDVADLMFAEPRTPVWPPLRPGKFVHPSGAWPVGVVGVQVLNSPDDGSYQVAVEKGSFVEYLLRELGVAQCGSVSCHEPPNTTRTMPIYTVDRPTVDHLLYDVRHFGRAPAPR